MKRVMVAVLLASILFCGCAAGDTAQKENGVESAASQEASASNEEGVSDIFGDERETYTYEAGGHSISFSSVPNMTEMDSLANGTVLSRSYYAEDASYHVTVTYAPASVVSEGEARTAEEYKKYEEESDSTRTILSAEDVSIEGWSGYQCDTEIKSLGSSSWSLVLYNDAGEKVFFLALKKNGVRLPIEDVSIQ